MKPARLRAGMSGKYMIVVGGKRTVYCAHHIPVPFLEYQIGECGYRQVYKYEWHQLKTV